MDTTKFKLITATAGATGVLAMGALTVALSGTTVAEPPTPGPIPTPEASTGETVTEEAAPTVLETPSAVPPIEGPAPLPPEEEGLPG